jgi:3-oxoacyl-[acyl-carrier protein] reductase
MTTSHTNPGVAIVTGGSSGIGRASAVQLGAAGYDVVVAYEHNSDLFDVAEQEFGGVDVVVHAAGRLMLAPVAEIDLDELDELHRVNIRGTFVVNQQAARRLRDGGSIVNFSTSVVKLAFPTYAAYTASKGAVEALSLILAREMRGRDITVNAIAPGPTATPLFVEGKSQEQIDELAAQPPLERLGKPEDIARVVVFLAGPDGHWVNGQVIRPNGGII